MSKTVGNALLALFLSIILSFIVTGIYIYYPLISVMLNAREGAGIGSTNNGFGLLFIIEPLLFIIIFALLQWKSKKS